ncbi:hypothetical protein RHGRI_005730 [Rhododendron griersonianum]|uniref:Tr-type G domain-containing protein n=1 Tax=Rhododendron griersonianum TaxID=479676 RepID=A0AAV6LFZ6_9ERIC|nr:hypothetical protein RHGRI_005730 [Rhododendron griersonianum]
MARSSKTRLLYTLCSSTKTAPSPSPPPRSSPTTALLLLRPFSAGGSSAARARDEKDAAPWWKESMERLRNIGISAHIDSGKTTLTERVLFYTGRIHEIHEVNIIDTPGHVDFTIEVERALRVLDGAILVLCSVGGVQSQSITVDRQMRRYEVPRLAFINKLDRMGADPWKVLNQARSKLRHNAAAVQVPIGMEEDFQGLVDIVQSKSYYFHGSSGEKILTEEVPPNMEVLVAEKRRELIEVVSEVDDRLAELFLADEPITSAELEGVQPLLDGVLSYLPCPTEVSNYALDQNNNEEKVMLSGTPAGPLVALAFKLEEGRFGQLTYLRIYEGVIRRGDSIINVNTGKKVKVSSD